VNIEVVIDSDMLYMEARQRRGKEGDKISKKLTLTLIILLLLNVGAGCLGNTDENQNSIKVTDNITPDNITTVVVQEQSQANLWEWMYWSALWNNYFYMPYYYHVYTPCYGFVYHSVPDYRPVYITPTVTRTVYQVQDSKGTVLYKSTDGKAADDFRYRAAQRTGTGFGSNYKGISKSTQNYAVKNYNSGDKPSSWKDNSKQVSNMRQSYRVSGSRRR
jgi:hypothetical protein